MSSSRPRSEPRSRLSRLSARSRYNIDEVDSRESSLRGLLRGSLRGMKSLNQRGTVAGSMIGLFVTVVMLIGALSFGVWAFTSRSDYKNNVDKKISEAVEVAKQQISSDKDKEFAEKDKQPLKTYTGPAQYGSVAISYPKTWSAYVNESGTGTAVVDGYFHPNFVPGVESQSAFALRFQVVQSAYDKELQQFTPQVKAGKISVNPFTAAKVSNILGSRVDGEIAPKKQGSMVLLPLRDKTLKVWTEATEFGNDFNTIILPNLGFSP